MDQTTKDNHQSDCAFAVLIKKNILDISKDGANSYKQPIPSVSVYNICCKLFLSYPFQAEHSKREEYNAKIAEENEKQERKETKELEATNADEDEEDVARREDEDVARKDEDVANKGKTNLQSEPATNGNWIRHRLYQTS